MTRSLQGPLRGGRWYASFIAPSRLRNGRFVLQLYPAIDNHISARKAPCDNFSPQLASHVTALCPALLEVLTIGVQRTVRVSRSGSFGELVRLHKPAHRLAAEVQLPGDPNNTPPLLVECDDLFIARQSPELCASGHR